MPPGETLVNYSPTSSGVNFDLPGTALNGPLTGAAGQVNANRVHRTQYRPRGGRNRRLLARRASTDRVWFAGAVLALDPSQIRFWWGQVLLEALS